MRDIIEKSKKSVMIFLIGALGYSTLEIIWRGYTHWTMTITGGICMLFIYLINRKFHSKSIITRAFLCALMITLTEFLVGYFVNIKLKWNVWDYSRFRLNFMGQICLLYSLLWFFLSIPLLHFCGIFTKTKR